MHVLCHTRQPHALKVFQHCPHGRESLSTKAWWCSSNTEIRVPLAYDQLGEKQSLMKRGGGIR